MGSPNRTSGTLDPPGAGDVEHQAAQENVVAHHLEPRTGRKLWNEVRWAARAVGTAGLEIAGSPRRPLMGEAAFVSGGPLSLDGQVAVLRLPGARVRQENRASGERLRASKAQTRGHGPFTEESLAGAEK